jgi:adenine phosphoribosyltransferase
MFRSASAADGVRKGSWMEALRLKLRDVPDFPRKGITFKDITPVLSDPSTFKATVDALASRWMNAGIHKVVGIESRGFIFASPLAYLIGAGCTLVRKSGKLPWSCIRESYSLEYGQNVVELHDDAIAPGERVLVVDDLLATGGTAEAAGRLVQRQGGVVAGYAFVIELAFLGGAQKLGGADNVHALMRFDQP